MKMPLQGAFLAMLADWFHRDGHASLGRPVYRFGPDWYLWFLDVES